MSNPKLVLILRGFYLAELRGLLTAKGERGAMEEFEATAKQRGLSIQKIKKEAGTWHQQIRKATAASGALETCRARVRR